MKQHFFALVMGFSAVLVATQFAQAQNRPNCAERATVVARLAEGYGEARQSIGLAPNNAVVEVFANEETGTWTITVTMPNGTTCLVASGQAYEELDEDLKPTGHSL